MALPSYYKTGTATLAVQATEVTGQNTFWSKAVAPGDLFGTHKGVAIRIEEVLSDTSLKLAHPWPQVAQVAAPYEIQIVPDAARVQESTRLLLEQLQQGLWLDPDATGTLAQRAAYNGEAQGFIYLRTDVNPFLVYVKMESGAWSVGTSLLGPKGNDGSNGVSPPGTFYDVVFEASGRPAAGEEFATLFARSVAFPAGLAGSLAQVNVAPTGGAALFTLLKNGVQFGTLTFAVASKTGVFAGSATTFAPGNKLTIRAPSPRNAALSDLIVTLAGNRI